MQTSQSRQQEIRRERVEAVIDGRIGARQSWSRAHKEQGVKELARQRELSRTTRPQRDTARAFAPKPIQPKQPPAR